MGALLEVISGRVTNPGATITALTPNTGDSFTVRPFSAPGSGRLLSLWALGANATGGTFRVRSPLLHDNVQGIRTKWLSAQPVPLKGTYMAQPIQSQDVLILESSGGGAETDMASILNYYTDVAGASARLFSPADIKPRVRNVLTVETTLTTGGTVGDYGGSAALNSNFGLLKADTDYAILGYDTDTAVCTVGYRGPDTSNFRVGGPGSSSRIETRDWFEHISTDFGLPLIPVFDATNVGGTFIDLVHNAAGATVVVQTILAELAS